MATVSAVTAFVSPGPKVVDATPTAAGGVEMTLPHGHGGTLMPYVNGYFWARLDELGNPFHVAVTEQSENSLDAL